MPAEDMQMSSPDPSSVHPMDGKRIMGIFAHPDDPEFFAGGTFALWAKSGAHITFVVATRGDKGSDDPQMTSERIAQIRDAEERAAADVLGVQEVIFLNYADGTLFPDLNLRRDITRLIRMKQPDIVVTLDPRDWFAEHRINHPDHRAIGAATLDAIYPTARDRLNFIELERDEGLPTHKVHTIYIAGAIRTNTIIDVTTTIETKIASLYEHQSQIGAPQQMAERVRSRALDPDAPDEYPRYIEKFFRIELR